MVCNPGMTDAELIDALGGPARVCELLNIPKHRGVQRVHNWKARGIPARVKLQWPGVFLRAIEHPQPRIAEPAT
jgi:hypothetical protein